MKLVIQIPCFNEESTLAATIKDLPRSIAGIDEIEVLIVDDGSSDGTVAVAEAARVDHIVRLPTNQGLAKAFKSGLEACLRAGADIIVNTDADNQYCGADVEKLVRPILDGTAQIVVGARPIDQVKHFSWTKKLLQKLGSWVVRMASNTDIPDSPSGFRALSRDAALQLNVFNDYTYTLETIIQAGHKNFAITSVPIRTNEYLRPSRLVKSMPRYIARSMGTIFRIFMIYRPLKFFFSLAALPSVIGVGLLLRWLILFWFYDPTRSRTPSLIAAAILLVLGFLLVVLGLVADLMGANRRLLEEIQLRLRKQDLRAGSLDPDQ